MHCVCASQDKQSTTNDFTQSKSSVKFVVFVSVLHGDRLRAALPFVEARERVIERLHAQRDLPFVVVRPSLLLEDLLDVYMAIEKVMRN